ncbi:hypothetical protein I4U23_000926 [Adineta vaga]|nr:hypothetical protein I4U23_000926 [Adineta vaga]
MHVTISTMNTWDVAQRWAQSVAKEESTRKQWEQMHGWMADYDAKGNFVPKKRIFENTSRFSDTIPNTRGHDYGWRLQNDLGQEIATLQTRFNSQHKKRRSNVILGSD